MRYTLSYVDGVTFGRRASAPAHFGVGLRDTVCPPSTVFAAYNQYGAANGQPQPPDRTIHVYPFNQQEGGEAVHMRRQLRWLNARMGNRAAATPPGSLRCDASTAAGRGFEFLRRHDLSFSSSARPARSPRHKGRPSRWIGNREHLRVGNSVRVGEPGRRVECEAAGTRRSPVATARSGRRMRGGANGARPLDGCVRHG